MNRLPAMAGLALAALWATGADAATLEAVQGESDEISFYISDEFDFATRIVLDTPSVICAVHVPPADVVSVRSDAKRGKASSEPLLGEEECTGVGELVPMPEITVTCRWDKAHWQRSTGRTVTLNGRERHSWHGTAMFASADCEVTVDGELYQVPDSWIRRDVERLR